MLQGLAIQKLHGDKCLTILLADVINGADIGVIQGRRGLRFALETTQSLGVFGYFIGQKLQRHEAMQPSVLGLVDNTHPASAELLDDAVMRNGLAEHRTNAMAYGFASQRWWPVELDNSCSA